MFLEVDVRTYRYDLHFVPNGKYQFIKCDLTHPEFAGAMCVPELTESDVREVYRAKFDLDEEAIQDRLNMAKAKFVEKQRKAASLSIRT